MKKWNQKRSLGIHADIKSGTALAHAPLSCLGDSLFLWGDGALAKKRLRRMILSPRGRSLRLFPLGWISASEIVLPGDVGPYAVPQALDCRGSKKQYSANHRPKPKKFGGSSQLGI